MNIFGLARRYRSGQRLRHIVAVLVRHGFGHIIERLNLTENLPLLRRLRKRPASEHSVPVRLRMVLEELGPTFVKLGQMLSGRPDLLPDPYIRELRKLRDHVGPFPTDQARAVIERELHAPVEKLFTSFEDTPLASGSMAQVHAAVIDGDTEVVVKVKRPDIERIMEMDIDLLQQLARLIEKHVPEAEVVRPRLLVEEFRLTTQRELNFISEASYTGRFHRMLLDNEHVVTPEVFWDYTTGSVLTMTRIRGTPLTDLETLRQKGMNLPRLAQIGADAFMKQFLEEGLFDADPHAGNILVLEDGRVGIVDFGMVGHLSEDLRSQLATTILALVYGDVDLMVEVGVGIGVFNAVEDQDALRADLKELLGRYHGLPIKYIQTRDVFAEIMELARRYRVMMPREFVMLGRSLATVEALARELDPNFDTSKVMEPYAKKLLLDKVSPKRLMRTAGLSFWQFSQMLQAAPRTLRRLGQKLMDGNFSVTLHHRGLQEFTLEVEKSSNRLAFSVILAAIIVGSSVIILSKVGPAWHDISLLGVAGYILAALLGFWLVIAILRSGRM